MRPGQAVLCDHDFRVTFVRDLGDGSAIIQIGPDAQIVDINRLSTPKGTP